MTLEGSPRRAVAWGRRHRTLVVLLTLIGLLFGGFAGFAFYLNSQLTGIPRIASTMPEGLRPPTATATVNAEPGALGPPVNILLAGVDNGDDGSSISQEIRAGTWRPGHHRSDTIMVMHVTADRKRVYIVSIPRDTLAAIDGHGQTKINAAFSYGGPGLMQLTVEQFTGIRMDHLAIIDWNGFRDLSTALGGVTVHVTSTFTDPMHHYTWTAGDHTLAGNEALEYVRTRYGLANGDFDRIQRQQNFLREMLRKLVSRATLTNPVTLADSLGAITQNVVVDDGFSDADIRGLAFDMRGIRTEDVTFLTVPITGFSTVDGASVDLPDVSQTHELFAALFNDRIEDYLTAHPSAGTLKDPTQIR
jgi:LCP family protein required for cell wall assembly